MNVATQNRDPGKQVGNFRFLARSDVVELTCIGMTYSASRVYLAPFAFSSVWTSPLNTNSRIQLGERQASSLRQSALTCVPSLRAGRMDHSDLCAHRPRRSVRSSHVQYCGTSSSRSGHTNLSLISRTSCTKTSADVANSSRLAHTIWIP